MVLRTRKVAEMLDCSLGKVWELIQEGKLRAVRLGGPCGNWRVHIRSVQDFCEKPAVGSLDLELKKAEAESRVVMARRGLPIPPESERLEFQRTVL